ncbi:unnamed protein product [Symbiodinium pilosum]|uniref:Phosphatidic acid phosphatase type 2/haloperoxidase domain-containing protein n=1 Tax=Symbiodinium pilosum TaxID=2952 RepID=A0A812WE68_SYMPI|nr:unnamed protein product [Symbiodinium pilosum]
MSAAEGTNCIRAAELPASQDVEKGCPGTPSPTSPTSASSEKFMLQGAHAIPPEWSERRLYRVEFAALRFIQRSMPKILMLPVAMAIHYTASEAVLVPIVGVLAWTVSLPATASVASFACFSVSLNMGLKWMCQRPRPIWLDDGNASDVWNIGSVWEADYAFPSGHTHILSGILVCIFFAYELPPMWLYVMYLLGALAGFSRNYLGVHWCSDTASGFLLGCASGTFWGLLDVYGWLLRRGDLLLSTSVGLGAALALTLFTVVGRAATTPVHSELRAEWLETAVQGLKAGHSKRAKILPQDEAVDPTPSTCRAPLHCWSCSRRSRTRKLRPRRLVYTAGPALGGGLCLAMSGLYSHVLPAAELEACWTFRPPAWMMLLRIVVGLGGAALLALMLLLHRACLRMAGCLEDKHRAKCQVMLLFPLSIFALWTFAGAPILFKELGLGCHQ